MAKIRISKRQREAWAPLVESVLGGGDTLDVAARPGARQWMVDGEITDDGTHLLRIAIPTPPEDGKANAALTALIAALLGLGAADVSLVKGQTSRRKTLRVER